MAELNNFPSSSESQPIINSATDKELELATETLDVCGEEYSQGTLATAILAVRRIMSHYLLPTSTQKPKDQQEQTDVINDEQYLMSGAIHPTDTITRRMSNDATMCDGAFESLAEHMPWKVVGRKQMQDMNLFADPKTIKTFPWEWRTTIRGIERALGEQLDFEDRASDLTMVASLANRGGRVHNWTAVEYPEDIAPDYCEDGLTRDPRYWAGLNRQGEMGRAWTLLSEETQSLCESSSSTSEQPPSMCEEVSTAMDCEYDDTLT